MTVKIFVGNIAPGTDTVQLRELFEQHGSVTECDVLGGYGFVHMESEAIANEAIKALAGCSLNGSRLNIELSTATTQGRARLAARATSTVKVFVGNLSKSTTNDRLRELFETYGGVSEADVLGGFGFVHMHQEQEAFKAIKALNGYILDGNRLNVELSTGGTQGKSKERELYSGRGIPTLPSLSARARPVTARYDPYPLPPISSRRPAVDPYETYAYSSQSSPSRGASSGDSFARDLLELYIKNRAAFDAYANDPLVRKALNLPPVESDPVYYRTPPPPSSGRDYYERRRLSELSSSVSADPYASPSDYAAAATAYDSNPAGRAWPGAGLSSSYGAGGDAMSHSAASAKGRGHLYTSFE